MAGKIVTFTCRFEFRQGKKVYNRKKTKLSSIKRRNVDAEYFLSLLAISSSKIFIFNVLVLRVSIQYFLLDNITSKYFVRFLTEIGAKLTVYRNTH